MLNGLHHKELPKEGLPPRSHCANVPEHANNSTVWVGGAIAACAVLGRVVFGSTRTNGTTVANSGLNTEPGMTTGAAPNSPPKRAQVDEGARHAD